MTKGIHFGFSRVAGCYRDTFAACSVGDPISKVFSMAGNPTSEIDLGDRIIHTWESQEWKGIARGGIRSRKMVFVSQGGIIISKNSENLDMLAG